MIAEPGEPEAVAAEQPEIAPERTSEPPTPAAEEPALVLDDTHHDPQGLARELSYEILHRGRRPLVHFPTLPDLRRFWQPLLLAGVLGLYGLEVYLLAQPPGDPSAHAPAPLLAIELGDPCAQRQALIVDAITAYTGDHGEPPTSLSTLGRPYLFVPAVDPISDQPYLYERHGMGVALLCPNPHRHRLPP